MLNLPSIEFETSVGSTVSERFVQAIEEAGRSWGAFLLRNHGVPIPLLRSVHEIGAHLLAMDREEKLKYRSPNSHPFRGWVTFNDKDGETLHEKWYLNRIDGPAHARTLGVGEKYIHEFPPNIYPPALLHPATVKCFEALRNVAQQILASIAVANGVAPDRLSVGRDDDGSYFALNLYPGRSTMACGSEAMPAHTDTGTVTILHQSGDYSGLEVRTPAQNWLEVPVVEDALVILISEVTEYWTKGRLKAARHRAVLGQPGNARASITMFHTPPLDFLIEPPPHLLSASGKAFPPVLINDWDRRVVAETPATHERQV